MLRVMAYCKGAVSYLFSLASWPGCNAIEMCGAAVSVISYHFSCSEVKTMGATTPSFPINMPSPVRRHLSPYMLLNISWYMTVSFLS